MAKREPQARGSEVSRLTVRTATKSVYLNGWTTVHGYELRGLDARDRHVRVFVYSRDVARQLRILYGQPTAEADAARSQLLLSEVNRQDGAAAARQAQELA